MAAAERDVAVDALRAVALLGIVIVNVAGYRIGAQLTLADGAQIGGAPTLFTTVASALAEGRFYPLFSFLFGWGFAVQHARSVARGRSVAGPWLRRSGLLLVLGAIHMTFFFDGDILVTYAVLGVLLLAVQRVPAGWLAGIGASLVVLQGLFTGGLLSLFALARTPDDDALLALDTEAAQRATARVYAEGSFGDVVAERLADQWFEIPFGFLLVSGTILGMMMLGMAAAKAGWADPARWPGVLRRGIVPIWLVAMAISVALVATVGPDVTGVAGAGSVLVAYLAYAIYGPLLALLWAALLVTLFRSSVGSRVGAVLAPLGRASLTAYLSQSVIASLIFNGYGLGVGRDISVAGSLGLVVALWVAQVVIAQVWFRLFAVGPLEALARTVAYLRWTPLRRPPATALAAPPGGG